MSALMQYLGELWPIIADYGRASAVIVAMLALVWFAPSLKIKVAAAFVAGVIICTTIAFSVGLKRGNDLCTAEQLRAERAAQARDALQTDLAGDDDDSRLADILTTSKSNQERFDAFKAELARGKDAACRLTADDLASLRLNGAAAADAEVCRAVAAGAKTHAAGCGAAVGRNAKAALADYLVALDQANARLNASAAWYAALRQRYRAAPLR
jgi:hypothetical protein